MIPAVSATLIERMPGIAARADCSSGSHAPGGADAPPTCRACAASCASEASAIANAPRMYSASTLAALMLRCSAAFSV